MICSPYHSLYLIFMTLIRTFKFPPNKSPPRVNTTSIFTIQPSVKIYKNFDKSTILVVSFDHIVISIDHLARAPSIFNNKQNFAQILTTEGLDSLVLGQIKSKICMHLCRPEAQNLFHNDQLSESSQKCSNFCFYNREDGLWNLCKTLVHNRDNPCTKLAKPLTTTRVNPLYKISSNSTYWNCERILAQQRVQTALQHYHTHYITDLYTQFCHTSQPSIKIYKNFDKSTILVVSFDRVVISIDHLALNPLICNKQNFAQILTTRFQPSTRSK